MAHCPHCHQLIDTQAISCPYCRTPLKAYGHTGIPLHRATGNQYLCHSCTYDADDTCNFPQRPYAKECTLYQDIAQSKIRAEQISKNSSPAIAIKNWLRRYQFWLLILGLLFVSFLVAL